VSKINRRKGRGKGEKITSHGTAKRAVLFPDIRFFALRMI
jgi:hypothetical protein